MSRGINYLHSHSGIERDVRELAKDKFHVLIDEEYKYMFEDCGVKLVPFTHNGVKYYRCTTYSFFRKGGIFKNLDK